MPFDRLFLDTGYVIALLNFRDQYHLTAKMLQPIVRGASEVWTTEAVLIEIGNHLGAINRDAAAAFIKKCYHTTNIRVVNVTTDLLRDAVNLYRSRPDKSWGLTDCISFVVMSSNNISDALTADKHFQQAGFRAMLR